MKETIRSLKTQCVRNYSEGDGGEGGVLGTNWKMKTPIKAWFPVGLFRNSNDVTLPFTASTTVRLLCRMISWCILNCIETHLFLPGFAQKETVVIHFQQFEYVLCFDVRCGPCPNVVYPFVNDRRRQYMRFGS